MSFIGTALFVPLYRESYARDYDAHRIAELALNQGGHLFYIEEDYYEVLVYYYYIIDNQLYKVDNQQAGQLFDAHKSYDFLLVKPATVAAYKHSYKETNYGKLIKVLTKK